MKKEKSIETDQLLIKGNIMCWEGMMIQLSNVSCISTSTLELLAFPILAALLILGGFFMLSEYLVAAVMCIAGGIVWIFCWYYINSTRKANTILNIVMNSGNNLQFVIGNKVFLNKILQVLELIIIEGGTGEQKVFIDMKGSKISGNSQVLNNLNI